MKMPIKIIILMAMVGLTITLIGIVDAKNFNWVDAPHAPTGKSTVIQTTLGSMAHAEVNYGPDYAKQDFLDSGWEETKDMFGNAVLIPKINSMQDIASGGLIYVTESSLPTPKSPDLTSIATITGLLGMAYLKRRVLR